jgi:hypothetical protein
MRGKGAADEDRSLHLIIQPDLSTRASSRNVDKQYWRSHQFVYSTVAHTSSASTGHLCLAAPMATHYGDNNSGLMLRDNINGQIHVHLPHESERIVVAQY